MKKQKKNLLLLPMLFIFAFLMAMPALAAGLGQILLEPSTQSAAAGEELKVTVSIDTGQGNEVNSYQAILDYPPDKLEFISVKTDNSPFDMALKAEGADGKVEIVRGSQKALSGKLLSSVVTFKAKQAAAASDITVNKESAIVRSSDNSNILEGSTVQNTAKSGTGLSEYAIPSGIMAIFDWIKNFFTSFFK